MDSGHFESIYPKDTRKQEIKQIVGFLKEGSSCQVIALPGVGRGNLLGFLTYNKTIREEHLQDQYKWFHFVLISFAEVKNRSLFDVTKFMFLNLADSLAERNLQDEATKVNELFKDALSFNDELVLFQGLKRAVDFLSIEKKLTVVLLFDRFEEYVPSLTGEFFANLRILRNRAKYRFGVVFSVARPLEELLEPELWADYYEFLAGHCVYLPLLDGPGLAFRISYIEKVTNKKLNEKLKEEIIKITGGHMKLVRMSIEACLVEEPSKELASFLLQQKTVTRALFELWHTLTPSEQRHLELVTQGKPDNCESKYFLEQLGLLHNNEIQIPLLTTFITQQENQQTSQNNVIRYDENTNEILKGAQNISDMLTAAEYRLLRFLLEHHEQIVEREQIIDAVWTDEKSTAGVTDQALDQLILRVRKKIEEDVKTPKHLLTIKGRGFRIAA